MRNKRISRFGVILSLATLAFGCGDSSLTGPKELPINFTRYSLLGTQTDSSSYVLFYGEIHNYGEDKLGIAPVVTYGVGENQGSASGQLFRHFSRTQGTYLPDPTLDPNEEIFWGVGPIEIKKTVEKRWDVEFVESRD